VVTLLLASLPFLASFASGRFDLPTTSVAESLSALAPTTAGGIACCGWATLRSYPCRLVGSAGTRGATSMNGLPGGATLFSPPDSARGDVIMEALQSAMAGRTVRLGQLSRRGHLHDRGG